MVQEYVSPVRVYKHPFEMVMAAYEKRFPSCPQIPVVVECIITEDSWSTDDSQRQTTRRCKLNVEAPYLLKKMVGVEHMFFVQENRLDLRARVLLIEATNETFASRVGVVEKCRYFAHPENADWTCFEQSALLDVKNFFGIESTVEKLGMKQYSATVSKGKELIEIFMGQVKAEGIESLKPWSEDDVANNKKLRRVLAGNSSGPLSPLGSPAAALSPRSLSQPGTSSLDYEGPSDADLQAKSAKSFPESRAEGKRKVSSSIDSGLVKRRTTSLTRESCGSREISARPDRKCRTRASCTDPNMFRSCTCPLTPTQVQNTWSSSDTLLLVMCCLIALLILLPWEMYSWREYG